MDFLNETLLKELRKPGLPASLGLHAAVLVASIVTFSSPKKFEDISEAIAVEVVDDSQIREVTKGEKQAKQPSPTPRIDRVDDKKEQNAPGEAKKQVNVDQTPKPQEETAKEERKEATAPAEPPKPTPPVPPKPPEPAKPVAAKPPKPADASEEEDEAEEVIKQAKKRKPEPPKPDQAALAALLERQKAEEQKQKAEEARKQEEQRQKQQEEARRQEEQKKLADAKAAAERKKAEEAKKAQEAAKKSAEEQRKREAEQDARNKATADAARRALLASREVPANSGNTGQQVSRTPALGTQTATGQRLNPAERGALVGIIGDQIESKLYQTGASKPRVLPQLRLQVAADGTVTSVTLINANGDPAFQALAEAGIRAARQASPLRIPSRFAPMYSDWRSIVIQLNPPE